MSAVPFSAGRFRPACLFRPGSLVVLGSQGEQGHRVLRNLAAAGFHGTIRQPGLGDAGLRAADSAAPVADLAVLCDGGGAPEAVIPALAAAGIFACVVLQAAPIESDGAVTLRSLAERTGVRCLGPGSFGVAVPPIGLDATLGHLRPASGRVALVSQSAALCRTLLDWAGPSGVGFSHIVGVGTNEDIGYGLVLDWLSRDPGTGAILLDLRRLKNPRRFLSAARAAARLRPVVAIRAGGLAADPSGTADAVLGAALHRAGVLCVDRLEDLLGAAETLTRVKPVRGDSLAIVSNAAGPARLGADAALREGVALACGSPLQAELRDLSAAALRASRAGEGAPPPGGVLVVHAPEGDDDDEALAELARMAVTQATPLLVCALGETTGEARRRALTAAGVPAFSGTEAAVRAFAHLVQDRRGRAAARELPPSDLLSVRPDKALVAGAVERGDLPSVLRQYYVEALAGPVGILRVSAASDPLFGPFLSIGSALTGDARDRVVDLPPLNLALAHAMVSRSAIAVGLEVQDALAEVMVRLSALLVDQPAVRALAFDPCAPSGGWVVHHPAGEASPRLALPPYPSELAGVFDAGGELLLIRPIRPEDADAHAALFRRLPAEDIRRRFFAALREIPVEQIVRMTEIDYEREMAFVAVRGGTETVGVARLARETLRNEGEFAVVVQPDMKGRGVARHLMERLIAWGRAQGLEAIVGEILAENHPMRAFALRLGFAVHAVPDDPDIVEARLALGAAG